MWKILNTISFVNNISWKNLILKSIMTKLNRLFNTSSLENGAMKLSLLINMELIFFMKVKFFRVPKNYPTVEAEYSAQTLTTPFFNSTMAGSQVATEMAMDDWFITRQMKSQFMSIKDPLIVQSSMDMERGTSMGLKTKNKAM